MMNENKGRPFATFRAEGCRVCGRTVRRDARSFHYCNKCGTKVERAARIAAPCNPGGVRCRRVTPHRTPWHSAPCAAYAKVPGMHRVVCMGFFFYPECASR